MKNILLIATGGTIASKNNGAGLAPAITSEELLNFVPEVRDICNVTTVQILNIDSTNIQPEYWAMMAYTIKNNYDKYDGFVISHGTDTMAYTSSALSYLIQNADKPIVITGSQRPIDTENTDAKKNLIDSFRVAVEGNIYGVHVVFDGKVIIGTRAKKTRSKSDSAFESINYPYIAEISGDSVIKHIEINKPKNKVEFCEEIYPCIFLLKLIPGMEPDVMDYIGEKYEGVVIESYGVGGIPFNDRRNFLKKLGELSCKGKIIVIATQVSLEGSNMEVYEVGMKALNTYSVLQAYDMTIEAVVTKLMWIMAKTKDFNEVKEMFYKKIHEDIIVY